LCDRINDNNKELKDLALSAIYINEKDDMPIYMWFISFEDVLKHREMYVKFFSEELVNFILHCSGAMSFKNEKFYGIIVNSVGFDKFDSETKNFIISHELGHIMNGDFESSKRSFFEKEFMANRYAKRKGFKLKCFAWKLAMWEAYSLIPNVKYIHGLRNKLLRILLFIKHFFSNIFK